MKHRLETWPTYQYCFDLTKDEDQAFVDYFWLTEKKKRAFKEELQEMLKEDYAGGVELWITPQKLIKEILGA